MTFARRLALLVPIAVLFVACAAPPRSPAKPRISQGFWEVRRVLVLPFTAENEYPGQAEMITGSFTQALRRGAFSVVPAPEALLTTTLSKDVARGVLRLQDLVELESAYRADAVIIGSITRYAPYAPQVLGLDVKVISTRTGVVLWSAQKVFDMTSDAIAKDAVGWYERYVDEAQADYGPEVVFLSPTAFARYACHRLTDSMIEETRLARR
jgi:hypothetical protein